MKTLSILFFTMLTLFAISCTNLPGLNKIDEIPLTQFGDGIIDFSSEYSVAPGPWSSFVVLGKPDTYPEYGDYQTAWASRTADGKDEFLAIAFDTAQYVNNISIYETYNPGAVTGVSVRNSENGSWVPVYNGLIDRRIAKKARIMEINIPMTSYTVDAVKLHISSKKVLGWNEIDAVSISGKYEDD